MLVKRFQSASVLNILVNTISSNEFFTISKYPPHLGFVGFRIYIECITINKDFFYYSKHCKQLEMILFCYATDLYTI